MSQTVIDNATATRLSVAAAVTAVRKQISRETATFDNARMLVFLRELAKENLEHEIAVTRRLMTAATATE